MNLLDFIDKHSAGLGTIVAIVIIGGYITLNNYFENRKK